MEGKKNRLKRKPKAAGAERAKASPVTEISVFKSYFQRGEAHTVSDGVIIIDEEDSRVPVVKVSASTSLVIHEEDDYPVKLPENADTGKDEALTDLVRVLLALDKDRHHRSLDQLPDLPAFESESSQSPSVQQGDKSLPSELLDDLPPLPPLCPCRFRRRRREPTSDRLFAKVAAVQNITKHEDNDGHSTRSPVSIQQAGVAPGVGQASRTSRLSTTGQLGSSDTSTGGQLSHDAVGGKNSSVHLSNSFGALPAGVPGGSTQCPLFKRKPEFQSSEEKRDGIAVSLFAEMSTMNRQQDDLDEFEDADLLPRGSKSPAPMYPKPSSTLFAAERSSGHKPNPAARSPPKGPAAKRRKTEAATSWETSQSKSSVTSSLGKSLTSASDWRNPSDVLQTNGSTSKPTAPSPSRNKSVFLASNWRNTLDAPQTSSSSSVPSSSTKDKSLFSVTNKSDTSVKSLTKVSLSKSSVPASRGKSLASASNRSSSNINNDSNRSSSNNASNRSSSNNASNRSSSNNASNKSQTKISHFSTKPSVSSLQTNEAPRNKVTNSGCLGNTSVVRSWGVARADSGKVSSSREGTSDTARGGRFKSKKGGCQGNGGVGAGAASPKDGPDRLTACPLCQKPFSTAMSQLNIDAHVAACLSVSEDDIVW